MTAASDVSEFAIRHDLLSDDTLKVLSHSWKGKGVDKTTLEDVNVITDPFPCCVVKNFIGEKVKYSGDLKSDLVWILNGI